MSEDKVYNMRHSGEQVDDAVDAFGDDGKIDVLSIRGTSYGYTGNMYPLATDKLSIGHYYAISSNGSINGNNTANNMTGFILKVNQNTKYTCTFARFIVFVKGDKKTAIGQLEQNKTTFNTGEAEYVAISFNVVSYPEDKYVVSQGNKTDSSPLQEFKDLSFFEDSPQYKRLENDVEHNSANISNISKELSQINYPISNGVVRGSGTFDAGSYIILSNARTNLRKGIRLVFEANITRGTDFEIGFSASESSISVPHNRFVVTEDKIQYYKSTAKTKEEQHGISVCGICQCIFEFFSDATASFTLICCGNSHTMTTNFVMQTVAIPYVLSNGIVASNCNLTFVCVDIRKRIWCFGDSYLSYDTARWTYYLKEHGYDKNVLLDGFIGMGSTNARVSFGKMLNLGKPTYALWLMGMNDYSDADDSTPSSGWVSGKDYFLQYCSENNITPIFSTIPNVPTINHNGKNNWIKSSGYRYIDMCHAVGADVDVNWYDGMLASDGVHPTEKGAKALFAQVLLDFPEIMIDDES